MAQQVVNLGTIANDRTGDKLRDGGGKINANFTELYGAVSSLTTALAGKVDASALSSYALTASLAAVALSGAYADLAGVPPLDLFRKANPASVCFTKTGAGTVSLKAGTYVEVAGIIIPFASDTAVVMPSLTAGTDYAIYVCSDGTVRADASFSAPSGYTPNNSRQIGGFHYAPGGNAAAQAGGDTTPAINEYSLWDLKWRPACSDPRGMALVAGSFWCDIYMLGVNHHVNGTSKNNVTIADGSSPPKVPTAFGGNGSTTYSTFNWWEASEVVAAYGKQLLSHAELCAAGYGVTEEVARGSDPVTTGLGTTNAGSSQTDEKFTSKWGIIQATGVLWVWGRGLGGSYANNDPIRGYGFSLPNAVLLGGAWINDGSAGSRTSYWGNAPSYSYGSVGARGRCDHRVLA